MVSEIVNARFVLSRQHMDCVVDDFLFASQPYSGASFLLLSCNHGGVDSFDNLKQKLLDSIEEAHSRGDDKLLVELVIDSVSGRNGVLHATALCVDYKAEDIIFRILLGPLCRRIFSRLCFLLFLIFRFQICK